MDTISSLPESLLAGNDFITLFLPLFYLIFTRTLDVDVIAILSTEKLDLKYEMTGLKSQRYLKTKLSFPKVII